MPQISNITVKNQANTDVVFIARAPAGGDGQFAELSTAGATMQQSKQLRVKSQWNGSRTGRRVDLQGAFPVVDEKGVVTGVSPFSATILVPWNIPATEAADNAAIFGNLMAHALIKECMATGYSLT